MANIDYTTTFSQGGLFTINFYYECDLNGDACTYEVNVDALNNSYISNPMNLPTIKYYKERSYEYTTGATTSRDYSVYIGYNFLINVQGKGAKFNFNKFMIQVKLNIRNH